MPELPEVETVRRGLADRIVGRSICAVDFDWPKSFPNSEEDVQAFAIGAQITSVDRRAKVLIIGLSTDYSFIVHLKMTGQMVYIGASDRFGAGHPNESLVKSLPDRSTRVTINFEDGSKLFFNDQRKFGWVKLLPTAEVAHTPFFLKVGPEPLEDSFDAKAFIPRVRRRAGTTIKAAILDQTVLAGVGNIYADEALYAARIHPACRVKNVSDDQLSALLAELKAVMNLSIEKGGSSDRNYVNAEGKKGSYISFAKVFRKEGSACERDGTIITKHRIAARGTHLCKTCQKKPKDFQYKGTEMR